MSENEFEILDELYFIITYDTLKERVTIDEKSLVAGLKNLVNRNFVRCYHDANTLVEPEELDFDHHFSEYYYLASKQGLIAHNTA